MHTEMQDLRVPLRITVKTWQWEGTFVPINKEANIQKKKKKANTSIT